MSAPRVLVFAYRDVGHGCLETLLARGANLIGVFTHGDAAGEHIWFPSVAALAQAHAIPVYAPERIAAPEWIALVRRLAPELILSFYYRRLLPPEILAVPRLGAFNMHGSLLPKYRGRAPINWALVHGERETGATLHVMEARADAGDIVDRQAVPIGPEDDIGAVSARVAEAARRVLERNLEALLGGTAPRRPQDESQATTFPARTPEDGRIDWRRSAAEIFNLVRAVTHPYPGAFTEHGGRRFTIWWARPVPRTGAARPGEVLSGAPLRVAAGNGALDIIEWQGSLDPRPQRGTGHGLPDGAVLGGAS
jgi:methionyl-tRNA formyltransferase